jgi:uncharacterized membrane protein
MSKYILSTLINIIFINGFFPIILSITLLYTLYYYLFYFKKLLNEKPILYFIGLIIILLFIYICLIWIKNINKNNTGDYNILEQKNILDDSNNKNLKNKNKLENNVIDEIIKLI